MSRGLSAVVPVHGPAPHLEAVLAALAREAAGRPLELLVVDDGTPRLADRLRRAAPQSRPLRSPRPGAAAAVNAGLRAASHALVAQVDQDVVVDPGWLDRLLAALRDRGLAAVQGTYRPAPDASPWARVSHLDLALRHRRLEAGPSDHVCTGNTLYRRRAVAEVGYLDESFGYGYDNDLSYRLGAAGWRLAIVPAASAVHHWPDSLPAYLRQQYGLGYGRLDLLAVHRRTVGDDVAGPLMMAHAPVAALAAGAALTAAVQAARGRRWRLPLGIAAGLAAALAGERLVAGARATRATGDAVGLLFPVAHLLRDAAWVGATAVWATRRLLRRPRHPSHSMPRRSSSAER